MESDGVYVPDLIPTVQTPRSVREQLHHYVRDAELRHDSDVSPFYGETLTNGLQGFSDHS